MTGEADRWTSQDGERYHQGDSWGPDSLIRGEASRLDSFQEGLGHIDSRLCHISDYCKVLEGQGLRMNIL